MRSDARHRTPVPLPIPGTPPVPSVPRPERFTLGNGLRVLTVHRPELPRVAARLVVPAGSAADPEGTPGAAAMVGALLTEGTERASGVELNERIDALGASIGACVGHDFAEIDVGLLSETLEEGLALLAEVVARPVFPPREVARIRAETLDGLEARLDEPANVADDAVGSGVFGDGHPYGRLPVGSVEGVAALGREELVSFHAERYRPEGSFLVLAGDLGEGIEALLERMLGSWMGSVPRTSYPAAPAAAERAGQIERVVWEEGAQSEIRLAGLGIPRDHPDWIPGAVANYILGGSTITGRLGANLREDKGWTYGVRSGFAAGVQAGGWVVETAVDAGATAAALTEIHRELERMVGEPVEEEELARAREALILSLPRAFESPHRIVARLATVEAFDLPRDYWERFPDAVRRVSADEVRRVARAYFSPDALVRVTVGPRADGGG